MASESKYIADKLAPYESFWSSDAAAAAGAGTACCLAASVGGVLSTELVFAAAAAAQLAAFGRMYFHCHFFFDVFCGSLCGTAVSFALVSFCEWRQFGFLQPAMAHMTFVLMYTVIRKLLVQNHLKKIEEEEGRHRQPAGNVRDRALPEGKRWFAPTSEWQAVGEDQVCPPGLQYRVDMNGGVSMARRPPTSSSNNGRSGSGGGGARSVGGGWLDSIAKIFRKETAADRIAAKRARIRAEKAASVKSSE